MFVHQPERLRRGAIRCDAEHFGLHHVAHLGRNISHKARRWHAKSMQHEIDAVVRVAASRGHSLGHARAPLELRVANGGADRVRIRVAVADYQYFAHIVKQECVVICRRASAEVLAGLTDKESLAHRSRFTG